MARTAWLVMHRWLMTRKWVVPYVLSLSLLATTSKNCPRTLGAVLGPAATATLVWPWLEYAVHRGALHHAFEKAHENHHKKPHVRRYSHVPFLFEAVFFVCSLFVAVGVIGVGLQAFAIWNATLLFWFELFEWTHATIHEHTATSPVMLRLREFHVHHHKEQTTNFAVTCTTPDYVFGTLSIQDRKYAESPLRILTGLVPLLNFSLTAPQVHKVPDQ